MGMPRGVLHSIVAVSLCIALSLMAATVDWLTGSFTSGEFLLLVAIYAVAVLVPVKLARRSDAARYLFLVFVGATYLNWMRGIAPFPPFTSVALILQIPLVVVLINWLFMTPDVVGWFDQSRRPDAQKSAADGGEPDL